MKKLHYLLVLSLLVLLYACDDGGTTGEDAAVDTDKDKDIREYNLEIQKEQAGKRFPCDDIEIEEYVIEQYPEGSYLVEFDKTYTHSIPKAAVLRHNSRNSKLMFTVIARSKPGERLVEKKNIVGYESSFINLDSTKLGTAFFYLTMFECYRDSLIPVWEAEVPRHGGFNFITLNVWEHNKTPYITLNFEDGIISGHRDYNYFFLNGFYERPHLMETYEGLVHKRTLQNFNNDEYPDYYEYRFIDSLLQITDSIPFRWDKNKQLYISPVNRRWQRKY